MRRIALVCGLAAIVACAGVSKKEYQAKEAEATKYKQSAQELETKVSSLEQQNQELQSRNQTMQSSSANLQQQVKESTAATAALEQDRPVKISQTVLFKENSSTLTPEGKRSLDSMADALSGSKDKSVIVSGFTDAGEGGSKADNGGKKWQLSSARALTVAKYLASRGLDPKQIVVAGFGQSRPVAPNDTLANRAQNRRVEIMLTPSNQEVLTIDLKPAELMQSGTGQGGDQGTGSSQDSSQGKGQ